MVCSDSDLHASDDSWVAGLGEELLVVLHHNLKVLGMQQVRSLFSVAFLCNDQPRRRLVLRSSAHGQAAQAAQDIAGCAGHRCAETGL